MYEYAKHEFDQWLSQLNIETLTSSEKTIINIICKHFDEIAAVGTAQGKRAKLISNCLKELEQSFDESPFKKVSRDTDGKRIARLSSLRVEKFRGFDTPVNFDFSSQYTFFSGPNGSGKTSFCEALEYCLLGTIEESSARNIALPKYIIHSGTNKALPPELKVKNYDGKERNCEPNIAEYRFAFIEKNRIDEFSHIGATTAKNQTERIAALFGLSEFQAFVGGFTNKLDERYITLKSEIAKVFDEKNKAYNIKKETFEEQKKSLEPLQEELKRSIEKLNNPAITDASSALEYLNNQDNGLIPKTIENANQKRKPLIDTVSIDNIISLAHSMISSTAIISENTSLVMENIASVNLLDLYKSILKVHETWQQDICPACHTPLEQTVENPFILAQEELEKFNTIEEAKKIIEREAQKAYHKLLDLKELLKDSSLQNVIPQAAFESIRTFNITEKDFRLLDPATKNIIDSIKKLKNLLQDKDTQLKVNLYNKTTQDENLQYDNDIKRLKELSEDITNKKVSIEAIESTINKTFEDLKEEKSELNELKKSVDKESTLISYNTKMVEAYGKIITSLQSYAISLPTIMSEDLATKVIDYYNTINYGDAEFELISELRLPVKPSDRIIVKMYDGMEQDAMLLLSEGHLRILGLAILLAKAVKMGIPFIVFDDVVNAIDDDHRDGIAKLLIEHSDFQNIQMIITCHGEVFISKLEELVLNKKAVKRYVFLPADSLDERGVVIKYQDPTIPLKTARERFKANELKDCAAKCRQALECITGKLWNKISQYTKSGLSVPLRNLKSSPDLRSVTTALLKATKSNRIDGIDAVHSDLEKLTQQSMWRLLNKGTHNDESIPEFSRNEIRELLEVMEHLSSEVNNIKLKTQNITDSIE